MGICLKRGKEIDWNLRRGEVYLAYVSQLLPIGGKEMEQYGIGRVIGYYDHFGI